jgi:hypothetical protein
MVKHIVIFKLSPPFTPEEKEKSVMKLKEAFGPLGNRLKYIVEYRTGVNITVDDHREISSLTPPSALLRISGGTREASRTASQWQQRKV